MIADLTRAGLDVRQLLVEFHHRFDGLGPGLTRRAIRQLNERGFRSFYTSANGEEYAFIRVR